MVWKVIAGIRTFIGKCKEDDISAYAAQSAFFIVLSLIPFVMLFISLVQYTPVTEGMILESVNRLMPNYISPFLIGIIHEIYNDSIGIVSAAAVAAVWSAAKGIQYLTNGLNKVYDIEETRNWLFLRFRAILYTVMLVVAIVASLTLLVFPVFWDFRVCGLFQWIFHVWQPDHHDPGDAVAVFWDLYPPGVRRGEQHL